MKHELKCWPDFFQPVWVGDKTFEIRKNDRDFEERDEVTLQEWDPQTSNYTGREIEGFIRYLTNYEQKKGYVVFTVQMLSRKESWPPLKTSGTVSRSK